jgi:Cu2+-exporting ATPase
MEQVAASIPRLEASVIAEQKLGKTVSYIAEDGLGVGFVSISDAIKTSSKKAIATLMSEGVELTWATTKIQQKRL